MDPATIIMVPDQPLATLPPEFVNGYDCLRCNLYIQDEEAHYSHKTSKSCGVGQMDENKRKRRSTHPSFDALDQITTERLQVNNQMLGFKDDYENITARLAAVTAELDLIKTAPVAPVRTNYQELLQKYETLRVKHQKSVDDFHEDIELYTEQARQHTHLNKALHTTITTLKKQITKLTIQVAAKKSDVRPTVEQLRQDSKTMSVRQFGLRVLNQYHRIPATLNDKQILNQLLLLYHPDKCGGDSEMQEVAKIFNEMKQKD